MTELEKFIKVLKENLLASKMAPHIANISKFVYQKQQYVVVDLQQLNLAYCEKFVDRNPAQYYQSFIRFSYKAMRIAGKQSKFEFIFAYQNSQVINQVDLNLYRRNLKEMLGNKFPDYEFAMDDDNEICVSIKPMRQHSDVRKIEANLEAAVYKHNQAIRERLVPVATYIKIYGLYHELKSVFSVNFD